MPLTVQNYSHAYASCVTDDDSDFLDRLIANAADIKEPFVVVKGFANHDFNVPKHEPMTFAEASERFKEMNSPTAGFWLVHKEDGETDRLNIFPYYYDKTGQKGSTFRDANKPAKYHDLHSFIAKELQRAQEGLDSSKNGFSGISLLPDQEAIDRGYAALAAVGGMDLAAEKDLLSSISNGEIVRYAMLEIQRRLEREKARKQNLASEGKPHPIAEARMEKYEGQLAELGGFNATNSIDFKTVPSTKDLLYLASSVHLDAIYGDGKGEAYGLTGSTRNLEVLEKQYKEIHDEIVKIEKTQEKGQADKGTHARTQKDGLYPNGLPDAGKYQVVVTSDTRKSDSWISGYAESANGKASFNAKVFDLPSVFGIDDGRVSKLSISQGNNWIVNYDRGWDVVPSAPEHRKIFEAVLSKMESLDMVNVQKQNMKEGENMGKYDISARVNPLNDQSGHVKAMASVTIDNAIAINSLTVVEGNKGNLFVGYPQSKGNDGSFRDIVEFLKDENGKITKESLGIKNEINKMLTDMYKNGERATPEIVGEVKEPVMHEIKAFVTPLRDSETATKGLATVQVGDMFKINSIRINENMKEGSENFGKNFVAMPSRPDKSSESGYRDIVHSVNKEYSEALRGAVLKQFDNQMAWKNHLANKEQTQTPQRDKPAANKTNPDLG